MAMAMAMATGSNTSGAASGTTQPHLLLSLRTALGVLYSLPVPVPVPVLVSTQGQRECGGGSGSDPSRYAHHGQAHGQAQAQAQAQAHEFLMQFQTRNVRRKLQSVAKAQAQAQAQAVPVASLPLEEGDCGSTWISCLALLAGAASSGTGVAHDHDHDHDNVVHYAEALFAAQTMLHRLRRVKMTEAIDLEIEPPLLARVCQWTCQSTGIATGNGMNTDGGSNNMFGTPQVMEPLCHHYLHWIHTWQQQQQQQSNRNSTLSLAIQQYQYQYQYQYGQHGNNGNAEEEARFKGEVTMLSLAAIIMDLAIANTQHPSPHLRPMVATIASAIAVTAARLRYTPNSIPEAAPNTEPIITMIIRSFDRVRQALSPVSFPSSAAAAASVEDEAYRWVLYTCLTVLPDALLAGSGSGGGAHGSISMDPRCYSAVTREVRTLGMDEVCQYIANDASQNQPQYIFSLCQEWAKYAPIPIQLLHSTIPVLHHVFQDDAAHPEHVKAAMGFWIAIMEAGSWTIDQVLAASLLQKQEASQQPQKKRQSNKSKKRQKEVLEGRTTAEHYTVAQNEVQHRQDVAIQVAQQTVSAVRQLLNNELKGLQDPDDEVAGEGPVGGIVACANACLPYLIRPPSPSLQIDSQNRLELFQSICTGIQELCRSPSRTVRGFSAETIYNLHSVVLEVLSMESATMSNEVATALVEHFYNCSMSLAMQCGYPAGYFSDLTVQNDEEVENERNNTRDLLRTIAGTTSTSMIDGSTVQSASPRAHEFASAVLSRLIHACSEPLISVPNAENNDPKVLLFSETAMHTFSALARPLIYAATIYSTSQAGGDILNTALTILQASGQRLTALLPLVSLSESLPLARLYNLAVSSLSPMLSILCHGSFKDHVTSVVGVSIEAAMASLLYVPELVGPSSLRSSRYDIVGAMRTPGGEDHVACLALMRLATHSKDLSYTFLRAKDDVASDLCNLYQTLRTVEMERGRGVVHGKGVLPKSRRILLGLICHLEVVTEGAASASRSLQNIFEASLTEVASFGQKRDVSIDSFFQVSENVFDLASFSSGMLRFLFELSSDNAASISLPKNCLEVLTGLGRFGYDHMAKPSLPFDLFVQWNRLRAALFCLFRRSGTPDLPASAVHPLCVLIEAECNAIIRQCSLGQDSHSQIFREDLICEEVVPAGIFVHVVGEIASQRVPLKDMPNCIHILSQCQSIIMETILSLCPNPIEKGSFHDPRPMVAEAWILAILCLMKGMTTHGHVGASVGSLEQSLRQNGVECTQAIERLAVDTCVACVCLLLYPTLGKTQEARARDPGMTTDGPHMLVTMEFLQIFFSLGPSMLKEAGLKLVQTLRLDSASIQVYTTEPEGAGTAIIGAAIFRAAQGGLPPWSVECMPSIYSSLFNSALCQNVEHFGLVIQMSMNVRGQLDGTGRTGGELLSGRFFESMGEKAKTTFVLKMVEVARTNTPASWKLVKSLIKQACGGKKKDTDFRQRPALTRLDALDRV